MTARTVKMPASQLSRAITHEREQIWPDRMAITATWREGDVTVTKAVEITADQFFGNGVHGAPITGEWLAGAIDRLRKRPETV